MGWGERGCAGRWLTLRLTLRLLGSLRWLHASQEQWEKSGRGKIAVAKPDSKCFAATHNHGNPPSLDWAE